MSCESCKRVPTQHSSHTNEDEFTCTNKMADGRAFTDYRPQCLLNNSKLNSYDYRMFLMKNAEKIIENNVTSIITDCSCFNHNQVGTMLPERNMVTCNKNTCFVTTSDKNGLGDGRMY